MKSSAGFGQPKPLPGQAGYGEKAVDVLEKETIEMESRLQILQERLRAQQMTETDTKPNSGSRWKSSKAEKGSVRSYGKEISEKAKKKTMEISSGTAFMSKSSTLPLRSTISPLNPLGSTAQNPTIVFSDEDQNIPLSKDVSDWSLNDVADWLTHLGIPQYVDSFANNEMVGSMLLDITLEDLDYMNVKVLAHRKLILRAIEDLRQKSTTQNGNKAPSALLRISSKSSARPAMSVEPVQVETEVAQEKPAPSKVHWSQLEPLASKEMPNGIRAPPVNAADDTIDEEAERLAFQQAVEEWRRGSNTTTQKGKVVTIKQYEKSDLQSSSAAAASADFNDRQGEWVNPFALPSAPSPRSNGGGVLKGGALDEEAEHAEFVKAVEEWRNSKSQGSTNQTSADGAPAQTPRSVSVGGTAISNTRQLADALANDLEKEKEEMFKSIQKRREEAEKKLQEAAKELDALRLAKAAKPPTAPDLYESDAKSEGKSSDNFDKKDSKHSAVPIIDRPQSGRDSDVYVPNDIEFDDEDDAENDQHFMTSVRIEQVESNTTNIGAMVTSDEGACVIEYASDSD